MAVRRSWQRIEFLSTPSGWRATSDDFIAWATLAHISIHALRVEGDVRVYETVTTDREISIHALRVEGDMRAYHAGLRRGISIHALRVEGDLSFVVFCQHLRPFLSTPSGWRATSAVFCALLDMPISIHALRVEGDE